VRNQSITDDYYPLIVQLFPGLERLPTEAQVVFISVVFNRGPSMGGRSRLVDRQSSGPAL
jgi:hypothetical protein